MVFHAFDDPPAGDEAEVRRLLGGKGASLAAMTAAGLPVPPGFTLTTEACRRFRSTGWDDTLETAVRSGLARLEQQSGRRLGDAHLPLLVSVRSGAEISMPGMMDTVLDVGMSDAAEAGLAAATGDASFARDTHCRSVRSFASVVLHAPASLLDDLVDESDPASLRGALAAADLMVPVDPVDQVVASVRAVFESWFSERAQQYRSVEGIDAELGTAATVQAMVFGNLGPRSGTGVAFTRDPSSGAPGLMGDFLVGAQGEDVVAGDRQTLALSEMASVWPQQYAELVRIAEILEREMADMVDLEFTVEEGSLWMLQSRRAKRSPIATFRCAIDMAEREGFPVDRAEAVARCEPFLRDPPTVADPAGSQVAERSVIARGLPASPGVATGVLCLDPDDAVERRGAGESVILVRRETSPADVHGMAASAGIFTLRGGLVSHAAVVARDWGLPAVVGAGEADLVADGLVGPGGFVPVGAVVTVDGTAGSIALGATTSRRREAPEVETIRRWASELASGSDRAAGST